MSNKNIEKKPNIIKQASILSFEDFFKVYMLVSAITVAMFFIAVSISEYLTQTPASKDASGKTEKVEDKAKSGESSDYKSGEAKDGAKPVEGASDYKSGEAKDGAKPVEGASDYKSGETSDYKSGEAKDGAKPVEGASDYKSGEAKDGAKPVEGASDYKSGEAKDGAKPVEGTSDYKSGEAKDGAKAVEGTSDYKSGEAGKVKDTTKVAPEEVKKP
jgi:hypothetical protein